MESMTHGKVVPAYAAQTAGLFAGEPNWLSRVRVSDRARAFVLVSLSLAPALAGVWLCGGFTTQDGPAHAYSARVMESLARAGGGSPFAKFFETRFEPVPNWGGHALLAVLLALFPAQVATALMSTLTAAGVAGATIWLRRRVRGDRNLVAATLGACLLAFNLPWLLGFWSYLLGVALCLLTLGVAWGPSASAACVWDGRRLALVGGLLVAIYFCHPVALGIAFVGLIALAVVEHPGGLFRHLKRVGTASAPVLLLVAWYAWAMMGRGGGGFAYDNLRNPLVLSNWINQIGWVDPISLASRVAIPMIAKKSPFFFAASPIALVAAGFYLAWFSRRAGEKRRSPLEMMVVSRGGEPGGSTSVARPVWLWGVLAVVLVFCGPFLPDTVGSAHGNYLPQRVILIGLLFGIVAFDLSRSNQVSRFCATGAKLAFGAGLVVQTGFVWQYAFASAGVAREFRQASAEVVGEGKRVAGLIHASETLFRANPWMHIDCLLGVDRDNVVWSSYQLDHYYFPIRVRSGVSRPSAAVFQEVADMADAGGEAERARRWSELLESHARDLDFVVTREVGGEVGRITERWFDVVSESKTKPAIQVWGTPTDAGF